MCLITLPLAILRAIFEAFVIALSTLWYILISGIGAILAALLVCGVCYAITTIFAG